MTASDLASNHGVTIIISSHILGEISKFATRIGIIHEGKMIKEMDTGKLKDQCNKKLCIKVADTSPAKKLLTLMGLSVKKVEGDILEIWDNKAIDHPDDIAVALVNANLPPTLLKVEEEDLESYFLRTIGKNGGVR